jgi:hypothetical protein
VEDHLQGQPGKKVLDIGCGKFTYPCSLDTDHFTNRSRFTVSGTGLWAIEVGRAFPQAEFIGECRIVRGGISSRADTLTLPPTLTLAGIDLVPIQPK